MFHILERKHSISSPPLFIGLTICSLLVPALIGASSPASGVPPPKSAPSRKAAPTPRHGRDTRVIDDGWTFRTDVSNLGESQGWAKAKPEGVQPISIPSLWTASAAPAYSGIAWYWREIDPPGGWTGQTIRLRFEAVAE